MKKFTTFFLLIIIAITFVTLVSCSSSNDSTTNVSTDTAPTTDYKVKDGDIISPEGYYLGSVHTYGIEIPSGFQLLNHSEYSDVYRYGDNLIQYEKGKIAEEVTLPENAMYAGFGHEGYLFRVGSDVYTVDLDNWHTAADEVKLEKIASGVKMVLSSDYKMTSDAFSQPLFLMEDGSVKVYCHWYTNLQNPFYEGGYGGTMIK